MPYIIGFFILFLLLLAQEYVSDHQDKGWGMVVRSGVISFLWMILTLAVQEFGIIGWVVGLPLLVVVIQDIKGYSSTTSAIFFVMMVSLVIRGIQLGLLSVL